MNEQHHQDACHNPQESPRDGEEGNWLRDLLLDRIQFHIWSDATAADVEKVIDDLSESDEYDLDIAALVRMPKWSSPCEAQAAVDAALRTPSPSAELCAYCGGYGEVYSHAPDCSNDSCALNGDIDSCDGQVEQCNACASPPATEKQIEAAARRIAKADGLDYDEVCGYETDAEECDSGTCIAAYFEDHDPDVARAQYDRHARAAFGIMPKGVSA